MNTEHDYDYSLTDTVLNVLIVGGLAAFFGLAVLLPSVLSAVS